MRGSNPLFFDSYSQALSSCPAEAYVGDDLVNTVIEKNRIIRQNLEVSPTLDSGALVALSGFAFEDSKILKVLDFGGGGGYHHTIARLALPCDRSLSWTVVETPQMTRCAKILEDDSLRFFDNIEAAASHLGMVDVVLTSSSLQYTSNPLEALIGLLKLRAKRFFITRTAFNHEGSRLITIQRSRLSSNGPGPLPPGFHDRDVFYPITFEPLAAVEQLISYHDYRIRYRVTEGATHNGVNGPIFAYSYLAELS